MILTVYSLYFFRQDNRMVPTNITPKTENTNEANYKHKMAILESHFKQKDRRWDAKLGHTVATSGLNYPLPRDRMACDGPSQIHSIPSHPDTSNHAKPPQKKVMFGYAAGQMPQNLLSELSTVLNQTGRTPRGGS